MKARFITTLLLTSLAAGTAAIVLPKRTAFATVVWILVLAAYVLLELNAYSRSLLGEHSRFDQILVTHTRERILPEDLKKMERGFGWMSYEPSYFDFRVRPILRDLIAHRAKERLGIDVQKDPKAAAGLVDVELLNLSGTRKAESLYGTRNITTDDLARMVRNIEKIR
ncbi:MAG: hypothetical protein M3285_11250 [Actinomycetota bacterium]|nr:hypothetical protein [Actinomycetota bacterium]